MFETCFAQVNTGLVTLSICAKTHGVFI